MRQMLAAGLLVLAVGGVGFGQTTGQAPGTQAAAVVMAHQTKGTADQRAAVLLGELTQEEKIGLLSGAEDGFSTKAVERLGIPSFTMSDGPNGVRNGPGKVNNACAFPCGAALAATWDVELASAYGKAIGLEGRARGTHFQLGPALNICRVPVNGRNFEYFGEDPYLAGAMAARWAKACSDQGVVPTIKHFAANNQETNRERVDAQVDERVLREIYLPAFERAVKEGGIVAVMCSYNRLNGTYASSNQWLLTDVLKNEWQFDGLVMSDWGASHAVTDVARGLDLEMPHGTNLNQRNIEKAMGEGTVKAADIDRAVGRLLRTAAAMGWLDAGWVQKRGDLPLDSDASAEVALATARASIVLLKNEKAALPLDRTKVKKLVVVGPNAGGGTGGVPGNIGGGGSGAVNPYPARVRDANYLQGISDIAGTEVNVIYLPLPEQPKPVPGAPAPPPVLPDLGQVKDADAVIVCVGLTRNAEAEGKDRAFELPALQQALINAVAGLNPRTIVINNSGAGVGMAEWIDAVPAVVQAYYLGQEGGVAIAEMLFGDTNPSGRLISTFDRKWEENPAFPYYPGKSVQGKSYPVEPYTEGLFYGYRGYDHANAATPPTGKQPLFAFGFGLSYSAFEWTDIAITREPDGFKVGVNVKNAGSKEGSDVVEVYVGETGCPVERPVRELKAFAKAALKAGESKRLELAVPRESLGYWSPDKRAWVVDEMGSYTFEVGRFAGDARAKEAINAVK